MQLDESGRELGLRLHSIADSGQPRIRGLTPDVLSRFLLAMAEPGSPSYQADWASVLGGVSIDPATGAVRRAFGARSCAAGSAVAGSAAARTPPPDLRSPSMAPTKSFLQRRKARVHSRSVCKPSSNSGWQTTMRPSPRSWPVKSTCSTACRPGIIERLRKVEDVRVQSYRLPTVHVLIPNLNRPLLAKREFRRALCFGIDRKWIVERVLLGGAAVPGFEVVSGPFPAGTSLSDPMRYGYNDQIAPRPFEPRLAAILATVAWASVQNPSQDEEERGCASFPNLPELVLAHPNDPIARIACQSIQTQLVREGIPIKLQEFSADELLAGQVECDLRYAELAVWEPVVDARRIMGPGGLAGEIRSPYLDAALRRLDEATNWNDVRSRLAELHEIAHHELPVIPLWQTVNFFAYRASLRGIGDSPVSLYQNIDQWSTAAGGDVATAVPLQQ